MSLYQLTYSVYLIMFLQFGLSACHEQAANNSTKPGDASPALETAEIPTAPTLAIIVKTLDWIDLLPATINREALMEHYADLVIQRLDPETEASTQEKIINELNQAQGNASLDGLYVRLAGYMVVLDDREGQISEFILAPYSGAGIHQPAPAANQMILVHPQKAYKLADADQYQSVWVEGRLKLQNQATSISPVDYVIEQAKVSLYTLEDAKQAELLQSEHEHSAANAHE